MVVPHPPSPVNLGGGCATNRTAKCSTNNKKKKRVRISEAAPTTVAAGVNEDPLASSSLSPLSAGLRQPVLGALQVDDELAQVAVPTTTTTTTTSSRSSSFSPPPPLSDQERSDAWWSATDFAAVKESVKRQCRDHRRDRRYSDCLTEAYRSACTLAAATTAAMAVATSAPDPTSSSHPCDNATALEGNDDSDGSLVEAPVPISTVAAATRPNEALVRWVCDEGPRGLEVYSSRLHALRRQRHLQESKHAVLGEQARQRHGVFLDASSYQQNGVGQGGGGGGDEVLAWRAAQASQRARTFATLLGQADAWVAHRHLHDDDNDADEYGSSSDDSPPSTGAVDEPPEVTEESSPSSCDA